MAPPNHRLRLSYPELITKSKQEGVHVTVDGAATASVALGDATPKSVQVLFGFQVTTQLATAVVLVTDGATVVWQGVVGTSLELTYKFESWLISSIGNAITVAVTGGGTDSKVNAEGLVQIPVDLVG